MANDIRIQFTFPEKRIEELLYGHPMSCSHWLRSISGQWPTLKKTGVIVRFDREKDDEGTFKGRKFIKLEHVAKAIALMAKEAPAQFGQWLEENEDDITCDTIWQLAIFGKLVYC